MKNDLIIQNGKLIFPGRNEIKEGDLWVKEGRIEEVRLSGEGREITTSEEVIEAEGYYVSPGFLDLQVNGGAGVDFLDPNPSGIKEFADLWASHGTTSFLATVITNPIDQMNDSMKALQSFEMDNCLGFHVEGPFISTEKKGAHDKNYIKPYSSESLEEITKGVEDEVKMLTLAPEIDNSSELIHDLSTINAVASLGHTNAEYPCVIDALEEGAKGFTHLYNAMKGFHHREPGCVGAALDSEAYLGIIVDGHHVHPAGIRLATGAKARDKGYLITDAISATGMPRGKHTLGASTIILGEDVARLPDGTIAGSILTMDEAINNTLEFTNLSLVEAVRMATVNPAEFVNVRESKGTLEEGTDADLAVFDEQLRVEYTISGGEVVYNRSEE